MKNSVKDICPKNVPINEIYLGDCFFMFDQTNKPSLDIFMKILTPPTLTERLRYGVRLSDGYFMTFEPECKVVVVEPEMPLVFKIKK